MYVPNMHVLVIVFQFVAIYMALNLAVHNIGIYEKCKTLCHSNTRFWMKSYVVKWIKLKESNPLTSLPFNLMMI
jgi:hypothetical protein